MKGYKLIGKGAFTKAYLSLTDGYVYLESVDYIKECMSLGWFPVSRFFPEVDRDELTGLYKMEYYPKERSLKNTLTPSDWELYKELREIPSYTGDSRFSFDFYHKQFSTISSSELRDALKEALDACGNYGTDIYFEISPRNVAVKDGKLILLDCFFIRSQLEEIRR